MNTSDLLRNGIAELLSLEAISLELRGRQRDDILRELAALVPDLKGDLQSQEHLVRALIEREQLHSTGIGDGVAVPHARNALVGLVDRPIVAFGRHREGVAYGAIDDRPTHLFFLLVAPNVTLHLAILARISRLLRDPRLRQNLLQAERADKVLALLREAEAAAR